MGKMKILIADDHAIVREGTRQILEQEKDMEVAGEAADGREAIDLAGRLKPDLVIIDIAMPEIDGIEATRQIKEQFPDISMLVLTAYDDDQLIFSLLEAGAAGCVLKSIRGKELVEAVRQVHAGESVLHPTIARRVLNRFEKTPKDIDNSTEKILSDRETEVLRLATQGLSNQEIADNLVLSLRTIQAHLGHIFNKLEVSSRTEAVVKALKEGLISLEDVP